MTFPVVVVVSLAFGLAGSITFARPREEPTRRAQTTSPTSSRAGAWVNLAARTPADRGTEWIRIDRHAGAFRTLRIDVTSGVVNVRRVVVEFVGGASSTFDVDSYLTAREPSTFIDLGAPRAIERIVVMTSAAPAGSYEVYGSWGQTQADELVAMR